MPQQDVERLARRRRAAYVLGLYVLLNALNQFEWLRLAPITSRAAEPCIHRRRRASASRRGRRPICPLDAKNALRQAQGIRLAASTVCKPIKTDAR